MSDKIFEYIEEEKSVRSGVTEHLLDLKPGGDPYIHDHSKFKTKFSVWLATRRMRLHMQFKHERLEDGTYSIFLPIDNHE
jgi:hypothetical protein